MAVCLYSWNVNGIRSAMRKGFLEFLTQKKPDVLCLQEIKASAEHLSEFTANYKLCVNSAEKNGYSGTATLSTITPLSQKVGFPHPFDREGRIITLEFKGFYLVNVYTPNSKRGLLRLDYRINEWDKKFLEYLQFLEATKPVIFCGDLNVAHQEVDIANPKGNKRNAGFTIEERESFSKILAQGYVDTFRLFNTSPGQYSWWSVRPGVREKNIGWRIDYFCASKNLIPYIKDAQIHQDIFGADHCPVSLTLDKVLFI